MTETGLSEEKSVRTCGNCGARVTPAAVTCPSCDALLAAYEAPAGSATASDQATRTTFDSTPMSEPVAPAEPVIAPLQRPEPAPFDAEAAMAEARRTLGMPITPEPAREPEAVAKAETVHKVEPTPVARPVPKPEPLKEPTPGQASAPVAPKAEVTATPPAPEQTPSRPPKKIATPPPTEASPARKVSRPVEVPSWASLPRFESERDVPGQPTQSTITGAQIVKWGIILMVFLLIMRAMPFGISPFFFMVIAFIILSNVMKGSAKAGGRKSTSMKRLNDHDPSNSSN